MKNDFIEASDVVQICPEIPNKNFAGCFVVVCQIKEFGIYGYIQKVGTEDALGELQFVQLKWDQFSHVGNSCWVIEEGEFL